METRPCHHVTMSCLQSWSIKQMTKNNIYVPKWGTIMKHFKIIIVVWQDPYGDAKKRAILRCAKSSNQSLLFSAFISRGCGLTISNLSHSLSLNLNFIFFLHLVVCNRLIPPDSLVISTLDTNKYRSMTSWIRWSG